jgi:uncharacterized paraquat-inducible protein A
MGEVFWVTAYIVGGIITVISYMIPLMIEMVPEENRKLSRKVKIESMLYHEDRETVAVVLLVVFILWPMMFIIVILEGFNHVQKSFRDAFRWGERS